MKPSVGLGWNRDEYAWTGNDWKLRGKRMNEVISALRVLFEDDHPEFHGEFFDFGPMGFRPKPIQRPMPIHIGGGAGPAVRRAGRLADGWQVIAMDQAGDETKAKFESFYAAATAAGRNIADIGVEATVWGGGDNPDDWANTARAWIEMGCTQVVFRPRGQLPDIQKAIDAFAPLLSDL